MKKGIAIPYIIALILGIAVVALIGYWFFVLGGRIPGQATITTCQSKEVAWCGEWARTGEFPGAGPDPTQAELDDLWDDVTAGTGYARGCRALGIDTPNVARCQAVLGVG
jgi:hypothetical protein